MIELFVFVVSIDEVFEIPSIFEFVTRLEFIAFMDKLSQEVLLFETDPFIIFFGRSKTLGCIDSGLRYFFPVIGDVGIHDAFNIFEAS